MEKLTVYRWKYPDRVDDVTQVEIGTLVVHKNGKLEFLPIDEKNPDVELIRELLAAIEQKGTLPTEIETVEGIDGDDVLVLRDAEVKPGDPGYHHAVVSILRRAGFLF